MLKSLKFIVLISFISLESFSQPTDYYDGTDGLTGEALKNKLHEIIREHKVREYSEFRDVILKDLDEDPDNSDNIILFYKNNSIPKDNFASNNQQDFWNREHTWPSSHGFSSTSDTAYTDVHNLRPSDASVNTAKSNKDFNDVEHIAANEEGEAPDTYTTDDFWEPRDEIKGDVARILLYMDVRYNSSRLDLNIEDRATFSNDPEIGVLFTLLRWHNQDPVDDYETNRHEKAYGYQLNRNPFVDHPEWVAEIWAGADDPYIALNRPNFNENFGTIEFGSSLVQSYSINAYNLEDDITIEVASPFSVSSDNVNFSQQISLDHVDNEPSEVFTVYVKFEPAESNGASYNETLSHSSTNMTAVTLTISGKEGEVIGTTIAEARQLSLGTVATVSGVVIDAGNNSSNSRLIYDGTAGIIVRSFDLGNESANLTQGDSILVSGGLSEYGEALQIEESPITIEILKQGVALPEPQEITISQVGEAYESELVLIKGITFSDAGGTFAGGGGDGNFEITDGTGTVVFRIGSSDHPLVGSTIPSDKYDITGFVGQFFEDYQISVRTLNDFTKSGGDIGPDPDLITIAEARTKSEGEFVKIKGIVIGGETNNSHNRVIFDGTSGLVVRGLELGNASSGLKIGDSTIVSGGLFDYNGLLEIEEEPITIEILNSGNDLPVAQSVSISEVGEEYESELISLSGVSFEESGDFSTGNYTLTDGTNQLIFRIGTTTHSLVGTEIPTGSFDIVGYVEQDNSDYQLLINTEEDISNIETTLGFSDVRLKLDLIYPNPVNQSLNFILPSELGSLPVRIDILDLQGKIVRSAIVNETKIDVSNLKTGMYALSVSKNGSVFYNRFIKK